MDLIPQLSVESDTENLKLQLVVRCSKKLTVQRPGRRDFRDKLTFFLSCPASDLYRGRVSIVDHLDTENLVGICSN